MIKLCVLCSIEWVCLFAGQRCDQEAMEMPMYQESMQMGERIP